MEIDHIEYLGWQDHGVPSSPSELLRLLAHLDSFTRPEEPVMVHCSAGVGRTGTCIAIAWLIPVMQRLLDADETALDALRKSAELSSLGPLPVTPHQDKPRGFLPSLFNHSPAREPEDSDLIDFDPVMAIIDHLRDQRTTMVQTSSQVEYVYTCCRLWWKGARQRAGDIRREPGKKRNRIE